MVVNEVQNELSDNFRGYARVPLHQLLPNSARDEDPKNIDRLLRLFEQSCHRLDPDHFIPVVVEEHVLQAMLSAEGLEEPHLTYQSPPLLSVPGDNKLKCLHGKHRWIAATKHLECAPPQERWWGVKLYNIGISDAAKTAIQEDTSTSKHYSDGDIFRHYRLYLKSGDEEGISRWRAQLSKTKERNLLQIQRTDCGKFMASLDALLPYSGLWADLQLGAFNRILPLRCFEEMCNYLEAIRLQWDGILGEEMDASVLDVKTVKSIELSCPKDSASDANNLRNLAESKQIFPTVRNEAARRSLVARLMQCSRILSIHTFLEDTIYMQACHSGLMRLLPGRQAIKESFRVAFKRRFSMDSKFFLANYLDLWLHSMRHFSKLSDLPCSHPRMDRGHPRPPRAQVLQASLQELASRAHVLGFRSPQIVEILEDCTEVPKLDELPTDQPKVSCDCKDTATKDRCNRPSFLSIQNGIRFLFMEHVFRPLQTQKRSYITPTYILFDICKSFWGNDAPMYAFESDRLGVPYTYKYTASVHGNDEHNSAEADDTLENMSEDDSDFGDICPRANRDDEEVRRIQAEKEAAFAQVNAELRSEVLALQSEHTMLIHKLSAAEKERTRVVQQHAADEAHLAQEVEALKKQLADSEAQHKAELAARTAAAGESERLAALVHLDREEQNARRIVALESECEAAHSKLATSRRLLEEHEQQRPSNSAVAAVDSVQNLEPTKRTTLFPGELDGSTGRMQSSGTLDEPQQQTIVDAIPDDPSITDTSRPGQASQEVEPEAPISMNDSLPVDEGPDLEYVPGSTMGSAELPQLPSEPLVSEVRNCAPIDVAASRRQTVFPAAVGDIDLGRKPRESSTQRGRVTAVRKNINPKQAAMRKSSIYKETATSHSRIPAPPTNLRARLERHELGLRKHHGVRKGLDQSLYHREMLKAFENYEAQEALVDHVYMLCTSSIARLIEHFGNQEIESVRSLKVEVEKRETAFILDKKAPLGKQETMYLWSWDPMDSQEAFLHAMTSLRAMSGKLLTLGLLRRLSASEFKSSSHDKEDFEYRILGEHEIWQELVKPKGLGGAGGGRHFRVAFAKFKYQPQLSNTVNKRIRNGNDAEQ